MYPEGQEILVVVDEPQTRARIAHILRAEGFTVSAAAEGLAALRALGKRRFALIIASTRLPGSLDGKTTVRQARTRQPWLKALYLGDRLAVGAGRADIARSRRGNPDCDELIAVPFERHELLGCTFELLHRRATPAYDLALRARTALRAS
ncbi:MAG TPA: response regulator [Stellaceae bacterium]|nr:response regulator [Stellaceae bacterium]